MCSPRTRRLIRTPEIVVGGLRFHRDSIFFYLFVSPSSSLKRTQPKPATCSGVRFEKCMSKSEIWSTSSLKSATPKPPFETILQLKATLTAYIFENTIYIIRQVRCKLGLQGVSYVVSKRHELSSMHKRLKIGLSFYQSSLNYAFYFIARLRSKRNSSKLCQTVDSKSR